MTYAIIGRRVKFVAIVVVVSIAYIGTLSVKRELRSQLTKINQRSVNQHSVSDNNLLIIREQDKR